MENKLFADIGETLYTDVLPNGLRVLTLKKPGFRKAYACFVANYGGADRRFRLGGELLDTPAGVAHFLEHKMFDMPDGTSAMETFSKRGASPNAGTSSAFTSYYFTSTEDFYDNLETLLTFVSTPFFTDESVQKEQGIIGQEIMMVEDSPDFARYYGLLKCLYAENPVRESVAGSVESIAAITAKTLYDCHKVFYSPSNMTLCAVGDVEPQRVRDMAERILPAERGETPERVSAEGFSKAPFSASWSKRMEVSAPSVFIGAKLEPAAHGTERLRQEVIAQLAMDCMFGSSSRFYTGLYADGLIRSDFSAESEITDCFGHVVLGGECREPERLLEAVGKRLLQTAEQGIDPAYFERVKRASLGSGLYGLDSFPQCGLSLALGSFAGYCELERFAILRRTTLEQVAGFAAACLSPDNLAMAVTLA